MTGEAYYERINITWESTVKQVSVQLENEFYSNLRRVEEMRRF
jgi:hypothetical protein